MIPTRYFRQKIALTFSLFSALLGLIFFVLIWLSIEKSDDEVGQMLLSSHAERLTQYFEETNSIWERDQITGIEILVKGRDKIPESIAPLPLGYYEEGEDDLFAYTLLLQEKKANHATKVHLVFTGAPDYWAEQYEPLIMTLLGVVTLLVVVIGSLIGILLSRRLSDPLQTLTQRIRITNPNTLNFTPLERNDEFGEISQAFSHTLRQINEVLEREKQFSRYASHELRTPVAIINSSINLWKACEEESDQDKAEKLKQRAMDRISIAAQQMEDVIQTFLVLGKDNTDWKEGEAISLQHLLDNLIEKYQHLHSSQTIEIDKSYTDKKRDVTSHTAVTLVLSNVLRNAFDYCASQIQIELDGNSLRIANDIDALRIENADHFGFGLKIIEDLCQMLNWQFDYEDTQEGRFTIWLKLE